MSQSYSNPKVGRFSRHGVQVHHTMFTASKLLNKTQTYYQYMTSHTNTAQNTILMVIFWVNLRQRRLFYLCNISMQQMGGCGSRCQSRESFTDLIHSSTNPNGRDIISFTLVHRDSKPKA